MAGTSAFTFVVVFHAKLNILVIGSSEHHRETNEQVSPYMKLRFMPYPCSRFYADIKTDNKFENRFDIRLWNMYLLC